MFEEDFILWSVRLAALLKFAKQPLSIQPLEGPEFLKLRRLAVPTNEFSRSIIDIVVRRRCCDQRGELAVTRFVGVANIHDVNSVNVEICNDIDFMIAVKGGKLFD